MAALNRIVSALSGGLLGRLLAGIDEFLRRELEDYSG
jgi:hypothetical protein